MVFIRSDFKKPSPAGWLVFFLMLLMMIATYLLTRRLTHRPYRLPPNAPHVKQEGGSDASSSSLTPKK